MTLKSEQYGEIYGLKPFRGEIAVGFVGQSQPARKLDDAFAVTKTVAEAADQAYDYVVITTKALPELYPTSELVAPLLSSDYKYPQPIYVLMQNGLGVERDLHAALQKKESTRSASIITGSIQIMTNMIGDTIVHGDFSRFLGNFYLGEDGSPTTTAAHEEGLHRFVDLLNQGGCEAKADPYVQAAKFRKNLWNASLSMLSCLTRTPAYTFFTDKLAAQGAASTLHTIVTELVTIGKALGHPSEYLTDPTQFVEHYQKHHLEETTAHKSSALLDVEAGKPFELEVILGEVVRQGKKLNVPIPTLEMMYNTLNILQRQFVLAAANK
ncbi:hypothetical protein FRC04_010030 [Tulasnella sp. 424]|nr:hypothetical protein FRC04_010030 [Tulasnella sp. 424]